MPRNRVPPPPGPGRPKGSLNKGTQAIRDVARGLLEDPKYIESLRYRLMQGKAPHMEVLLHHYGYGKPSEKLEVSMPKAIRAHYTFTHKPAEA